MLCTYTNLLLDAFKLCFVLISCFLFVILPSLTASASLSHIDISFLMSLLAVSWFLVILTSLGYCFLPSQYVLPCFPQHCYTHFYLSHWYSVCWVYLLSDVFLPSLSLFPVSFHPQSHTRDSRGVIGGAEDECPLTAMQKLPKFWICCWQRL